MKQATLLLVLVFVGLASCAPQYLWRQGFSQANCGGNMIYTEVYPVTCVKDRLIGYQKVDCTDNLITVWQCADPSCAECDNNDTYVPKACSEQANNPSFLSDSYVCSTSLPQSSFSSAQVETSRSAAKGGCAVEDFDLAVYTSLENSCKPVGEVYTKYICNANKTMSKSNCGADVTCQACTSTEVVASCEEQLGFFLETECFGTTPTPTQAPPSTSDSVRFVSSLLCAFFSVFALYL